MKNPKGYSSNATIKEIRDEEIRLAEKFFNAKCACCTRTIYKKKRKGWVKSFAGFVYHHLEYHDGEPRRKNYPKGASGTWPYKKDVLKIVAERPEEFLLLCNPHHSVLEKLKRIYDKHPDWLWGILLAMLQTKT